jgi:hypothetical protein
LISHTTASFRRLLAGLDEPVRRQADIAYRQWAADPTHPGLQFKQVEPRRHVYSARVGLGYRALGVRTDETVVWFWIGTHDNYARLLSGR